MGFDQSSTAVPKGTGHVPGYTPGFGFPNSADNGISLSEQAIFEGWYLRGWMPGILCPLQSINYTDFYNDDYINNYMSHPKKLIFKSFDHDYAGGAFFDLTGPWNN